MQICKICNKPIKYIAISSSEYAIVDPDLIEVYTENGYRHKAYKKHMCEKSPEDKDNAGE